MATGALDPRQQAHALIDRLSTDQISAVVGLFTTMLDPVDRAIAHAPFEDEPIGEAERQSVAASKAWLTEHPGEGASLEDLLAEFGLNTSTPEHEAR